jgi:hypothetical protein
VLSVIIIHINKREKKEIFIRDKSFMWNIENQEKESEKKIFRLGKYLAQIFKFVEVNKCLLS